MTPNEGSIYGGTVVTITGRNFYPDVGSTYVVLGDVPNNFCNILYISETEIRCKMPP